MATKVEDSTQAEGASTVQIVEVKDPRSFAGQEALRVCQLIFELPSIDIRSIVQNLLMPGLLFPDQIYCLAAVVEEKVVGVAVSYLLSDAKMGYLEYIAVLPEFRGQGIGHQLYQRAVEILIQDCPDLGGFLFELQNVKQDMIYRKEFFLGLGAIPIDLSFYPLNPAIIRSGLMLMFHPLKANVQMTLPAVEKVFDNLSHVFEEH